MRRWRGATAVQPEGSIEIVQMPPRLRTIRDTNAVGGIIASLDDLLLPLHFERQKMTWNRQDNGRVDVIDVQVSKSGDRTTINAGKLDAEVYQILWASPPPSFVEQAYCTVCVRIGGLRDGKDIWWPLGDKDIAAQMRDNIVSDVVPFLRRMSTRSAMRQWLIENGVAKKGYPPPVVGLAILTHLLGDAAEAAAILSDLQKKPVGAWKPRIGDVIDRLGRIKVENATITAHDR
jgi:hypothetical protein